MREIKFRVCTIDRMFYIVNGGEYQLIFGMNRDWSLWDEEGEICNSNEPGTKIMQYTGLKDKNGKEIYEGDIINNSPVIWEQEKAMFRLDDNRSIFNLKNYSEEKEIQGNIYENPEIEIRSKQYVICEVNLNDFLE